MWRTLIESASRRRDRLLDVDLRDAALGTRGDEVGDDLVLELLVQDVGSDDRPVMVDRDAVVDDLGLVGAVDRGRRDLRRPTDAEDPVGALDDRGGRVDRSREESLEEGLVGLRVIGLDPAEVARLRCGGGIGRHGLGDVLPGLAALDVLERLLRLGLGVGLLRVGRADGAGVGGGRDLDDPRVALFRGGRLLREAGVDVLLGDGDALVGGQLRLELGVDQPLERGRRQLLARTVKGLLLAGAVRLADVPGRHLVGDPPDLLVEPPRVDLQPIVELVLADRLAVHRPHRREVVVVVGQTRRHGEDDDGQDDDQAEAQVQVEVPSVLRLPRRSAGALDDGFGSKGHGRGSVLSHGRQTPGMEGRGMVHRPREGPCLPPWLMCSRPGQRRHRAPARDADCGISTWRSGRASPRSGDSGGVGMDRPTSCPMSATLS